MNKLQNIVGKNFLSSKGEKIEILEYFGINNCTIKFENGFILHNVGYYNVLKGNVKNPTYPIIHNVGYFGESKRPLDKLGKLFYAKWFCMFERCYSKKYQEKYPSYIGCSVAEEWHNFQNFAEWCYENYNPETMKGWCLDKDILIKGNKVYSPETCCFIPNEINVLLTKRVNKKNNGLPTNVNNMYNKYKVAISTNSSRVKYIGLYSTIEEAFSAAKIAKENYIKEVADKWKGLISDKVYQVLYNYQIEITD